ncbi:MAG: hypothetical protein ACK5MU_02400 [Candidatus Saccharimonadales bacterium]
MSKKRKNILPRFFRFLGRICLSAGAVLAVGVGIMLIYEATGSVNIADKVVVVPGDPSASTDDAIKTSNIIWTGLFVVAMLVGFAFVMDKLNGFVRGAIKSTANFLNWPIFATEMVATLAIWGLCTALLLFWLPVGAILSGAALIFTELCFILAWLLYKMPKYKL